MVTADAGETAFEGAAVEEFVDDLRDSGTQRPVTRLIIIRVTGEGGGKVAVGALPRGGLRGLRVRQMFMPRDEIGTGGSNLRTVRRVEVSLNRDTYLSLARTPVPLFIYYL